MQGNRQGARRAIRAAIAAAALSVLATGCVSIRDNRGYILDAAVADSIQPGVDNKLSVERAMGRPTLASQFGDQDWYYITTQTQTRPFSRARAAIHHVIRVRFDDQGVVVGVDRSGMDKVVFLDPDGDKTETLGRDRGLLEDLFGNIGTVGSGLAAPGGPIGPGQ